MLLGVYRRAPSAAVPADVEPRAERAVAAAAVLLWVASFAVVAATIVRGAAFGAEATLASMGIVALPACLSRWAFGR